MFKKPLTLAISSALGLYALATPVAFADEEADGKIDEELVITGSRITQPGVVSSSPITSVNAEEINYLQEYEVEKIIRVLPAAIPGDGGNVNNGTGGAATVNLRGLGEERTLVLMDGKRLTPYNFDGLVDTSIIPSALIERVDIVTGGASAVYGTDAVAGAVNVVMKKDFEGVEFSISSGRTGDSDGKIENYSLTLGSNFADDRGNMVLSFSYLDRQAVLLGQRPLGLLGIDTADGSNYAEFLAGEDPLAPPAGCGGPNVVAAGGSTTSIPTRFAIVGGGAAASGQFREDGTLSTECSRFNFNPFNYYQTPLDRVTATAIGHFELTEAAEVYGSFNFSNATVVQQVAPSGTFGAQFTLPLFNPLIGDQARQFMIDAGNTALSGGLLSATGATPNWQDSNSNGVVDSEDSLTVQLRRRTVELGARSENFDSSQFQVITGIRGDVFGDWKYDASFQYGESNRTTVRAGYTNLTNIQNALMTRDGVTCLNGDSSCVPINLFGGFGTITPEAAGYAQAIALQEQKYEQLIYGATINGPVNAIQLPTATSPLLMSFGFEHRDENGSLEPDECLKLAPSSCQGGAGGNLLPISGGYKVDDIFFEAILPLVESAPFAQSLVLETGYRQSDYSISDGKEDTWKAGLSWRPVDQLLVRVMQQRATRAPNVGELFSPVTTGLDNATSDPCSVANTNISATLREFCISTGQSDAQVGQVQDFVSGQVNDLRGSDPDRLPGVEKADTFTAGFVWTPDVEALNNLTLSVDYYNIDIADFIGVFSSQEILDSCYVAGIASECAKIVRVGGDLTLPSAGIERFTTNLKSFEAEGVDLALSFGFGLGDMGDLDFSFNATKYLTQKSQSSALSQEIDCNGFYGTSCDPISDLRIVQRTSWSLGDFNLSAQWRFINAIDVEIPEAAATFAEFRQIDSYNYIDLYGSYTFKEKMEISLGIDNVFAKSPPVVGNEAGSTSYNSGNTFPSHYDVLGRTLTLRIQGTF